MSDLERLLTIAVFATYFGVVTGVVLLVLFRRRPATADTVSGRHHCGQLRALRRHAGSALLRARRRAASTYRAVRYWTAYAWHRLALMPSPVPVTPVPLVHGLAGVQ